jgi:HlyD family secretion protein
MNASIGAVFKAVGITKVYHMGEVEVRAVVWQEKSVLKTPTSSLFRHGENWAVSTSESGYARLRMVEIGQRNGSEAQVLKGLAEGENVIVHPSDTLKDGSRMKAGAIGSASR